jgi:hypothetical protein
MEKHGNIPDDPYCRVPFNLARGTEVSIEVINGYLPDVERRIQKAVETRGYQIVNIDWMRKELQLMQFKKT